MPTCGECSLLVKNSAGTYVCAGKQNLCFGEDLSPQKDASLCFRFERKEPKPAEKKRK